MLHTNTHNAENKNTAFSSVQRKTVATTKTHSARLSANTASTAETSGTIGTLTAQRAQRWCPWAPEPITAVYRARKRQGHPTVKNRQKVLGLGVTVNTLDSSNGDTLCVVFSPLASSFGKITCLTVFNTTTRTHSCQFQPKTL